VLEDGALLFDSDAIGIRSNPAPSGAERADWRNCRFYLARKGVRGEGKARQPEDFAKYMLRDGVGGFSFCSSQV